MNAQRWTMEFNMRKNNIEYKLELDPLAYITDEDLYKYKENKRISQSMNNNKWRNQMTLQMRFSIWKSNASQKKKKDPIRYEWGLIFDDIKDFPLICAYTGVELTLESNHINTISLDRIDSEKGYIPGNIQFLCSYINKYKSDKVEYDFLEMVKNIYEYKFRLKV